MPQALRTVITLLVLGCIADTSVRPSTLLSHSIGQTQGAANICDRAAVPSSGTATSLISRGLLAAGNMACTMLWRLLACTALLVACFSAVHAGPAFTTPVPSHAAHYHPKNPQAFDLTDFNNFLYSPAAGAAKWVVLAAGTYTCDPTINDNFGHWWVPPYVPSLYEAYSTHLHISLQAPVRCPMSSQLAWGQHLTIAAQE